MVKQKSLQVETDGRRCFIHVPAGRAIDLHNYLRSNRVHSAPPAPSCTGFDSIELPQTTDIAKVQVLLNSWK